MHNGSCNQHLVMTLLQIIFCIFKVCAATLSWQVRVCVLQPAGLLPAEENNTHCSTPPEILHLYFHDASQ